MTDGRHSGQIVKCRHHYVNGGVTFPLSDTYVFPATWSLWKCNIREGPCRFAIFRDRKSDIPNISGCRLLVFLLDGPGAMTFTDLSPSAHVFAERAIET